MMCVVLRLLLLASCFVTTVSTVASAGNHGRGFFNALRGGEMALVRPSLLPSSPLNMFRTKEAVKAPTMELIDPALRGEVQRSIVINAPADDVYRVASGFEDYPKWAGCKSIKVLEYGRDGLGSKVHMAVGMFGHSLNYVLTYQHQRPRLMKWHAISGSVKSLIGSYEFIPMGVQTKVVYKLNVDPGFWLPSAVKQATCKAVAQAALNELKKFTELPSTRAMLAGGRQNLMAEDPEQEYRRVYMLSTLM